MKLSHKLLLASLCLTAATLQARADENYLDRSTWSWSTSSDCAAEDADIRGIAAIADGNNSTCWHSNWHAESGTPERSNPHWVMIDRGSDSNPFYGIAYLPRQSTPNQACTSWCLYLSDTPFGDVPASSQYAIEQALGQPAYTGAWEGDITLKTASFAGKSFTSRYLLFVNLESASSSSAACAEFNLLTKEGYQNGGDQGNTDPTPSRSFNAVRITNVGGEAHRIAIDGRNLTISMNGSAVRLSNSGITVEYSPAELEHFTFENYTFGEDDPFYFGTKTDVLAKRFDLVVTPADGATVGTLTEIRLAPPAGAIPEINSKCVLPVTLSRNTSNSSKVRLTVTPAELASMASDDNGCYIISGLNETKAETYVLTVPADLFIDSEGAYSNALTATWTLTGIPDESGIDQVEDTDNCPTLLLRREGSQLLLAGIVRGTSVTLTSTSGITVASAPVSARGTAVLSVGSLPKGVYILSANSTTLKITL